MVTLLPSPLHLVRCLGFIYQKYILYKKICFSKVDVSPKIDLSLEIREFSQIWFSNVARFGLLSNFLRSNQFHFNKNCFKYFKASSESGNKSFANTERCQNFSFANKIRASKKLLRTKLIKTKFCMRTLTATTTTTTKTTRNSKAKLEKT